MSTGLLNFCRLLLILMLLPLAACYHMRADVEPINSRVLGVGSEQSEAVRKLRRLVEEEWKIRILESDASGSVLITAPYHFYTDTGFGMPAGGRKYYTQLRLEIRRSSAGTTIELSPYNFEMRTSYAFNQEGQIGTLYKHYPYEHYPGMFDLTRINAELDRVAEAIGNHFR